jgi:hypothetical protein
MYIYIAVLSVTYFLILSKPRICNMDVFHISKGLKKSQTESMKLILSQIYPYAYKVLNDVRASVSSEPVM